MTFTAKGRVYVASLDGRSVRCMARTRPVRYMSWGREADRLLLGGRGPRLLLTDFDASLGAQHTRASWSRPTGTSVISISPEGALLTLELFSGADAI